MALTNEELQQILDNLTVEERKQLQSQLDRQIKVDNITTPTQSINTKSKVKPTQDNSKVYYCPLCGSASHKKHGTTSTGMQLYIYKDCGKTFSENCGDILRYSHLTSDEWFDIIREIVNNHSLPQIARDCGISKSTAWSCRMKINQPIMTIYGYIDPEFFIYTLRRMPRHKRNYYEKAEYLQQVGLYDKLKREEPDYLQQLLEEEGLILKPAKMGFYCVTKDNVENYMLSLVLYPSLFLYHIFL